MPTGTPYNLPRIIGHRGSPREAPENTLESFRLAWRQGADGIEADFRLTADNRIVCMHDATTARTAGVSLEIADTPLKELRRLDVGAAWNGAVIATLDEILAEIPSGSWFYIEIKCGPEIIPHLKRVLQDSGISTERIRLLAFSAPLITELRQKLPDWHACWLCDYRHSLLDNSWHPSREDLLATLLHCGADGLASSNRKILDQELVQRIKGLDKELHVWTVDRLPDAQRLSAMGVDSIMTNRPGWLRQQLTSRGVQP